MGSRAQISALQSTKTLIPPSTSDAQNSPMIRDFGVDGRFHDAHEFVVAVDKISNLVSGLSRGEGDCFVKYSFPTQVATDGAAAASSNPSFFPSDLTLKSFQTPVVPVVPDDADIGYSKKHTLVLPSPSSSSIHRLLLHATAAADHAIPIELWVRTYTPRVEDKLIGKAFLSLEELRTRVMSEDNFGRGAGDGGRFRLTLKRVNSDGNVVFDPESGADSTSSDIGFLHFRMSYLCRRLEATAPTTEEERAALESLRRFEEENQLRIVPLAVVLHKACGMKTLARVNWVFLRAERV